MKNLSPLNFATVKTKITLFFLLDSQHSQLSFRVNQNKRNNQNFCEKVKFDKDLKWWFWWHTWKICIGCGIIPVLVFSLMPFLPETPNYLVMTGNREDAHKALSWLRGEQHDIEAFFVAFLVKKNWSKVEKILKGSLDLI